MESPRAPFLGWPVQLYDAPGQFFLWYVAPATLVSQFDREDVDLHTMQRFVRFVDGLREAQRPTIAAAGGLVAIHDWRKVRHVAPAARSYMWAASKKLGTGDLRAVHTAIALNPMVRLLAETYNLLISQIARVPVCIHADPLAALAKYRVSPPAQGGVFPQPALIDRQAS
jgi:hypothetical protein